MKKEPYKRKKDEGFKAKTVIVLTVLFVLLFGMSFSIFKPKTEKAEKELPDELKTTGNYIKIPIDNGICEIPNNSNLTREMESVIVEAYSMYRIESIYCHKVGRVRERVSPTEVNCTWNCEVFLHEHHATIGLSKVVNETDVIIFGEDGAVA